MVAMKKLLLVCVMAACGGGGGPVDSGKEFKDLSTAEATDECNYLADAYPEHTYTCAGDDDSSSTGFSHADCANADVGDVPDTCTMTVGQFEDCEADIYALSDAQLCDDSTQLPSSCAPLFSSACQGDDTSSRVTIKTITNRLSTVKVTR